jgi:hypothetical protein
MLHAGIGVRRQEHFWGITPPPAPPDRGLWPFLRAWEKARFTSVQAMGMQRGWVPSYHPPACHGTGAPDASLAGRGCRVGRRVSMEMRPLSA